MSEHGKCGDCGKCRDVKVADTWCLDCEDWSCEHGEDCGDATEGKECMKEFDKYASMHFVSGRGYGKRSFLARLADSVRGRK